MAAIPKKKKQQTGQTRFDHGQLVEICSVAIFGDLSRIWLLLAPFGYQIFFLATCPFWLLLIFWRKTGFEPVLALSHCALMWMFLPLEEL